MEAKLSQLERDIELRNPEKRKIIQAYENAEFARLDAAVYSALEKKYSSLRGFFEKQRTCGYDVIEAIREAGSQFQQLETVKKQILPIVDFFGSKEDEDMKVMKNMLSKLTEIYGLYKECAPLKEEFYILTANVIKDFSASAGIGIETTVKDLKYLDEVSRIVMPTREEAEAFLKMDQAYGKNMLDILRGSVAITKKTLSEAAKTHSGIEKIILPTAEAYDSVQRGTWDYNMKEFNRVYSK